MRPGQLLLMLLAIGALTTGCPSDETKDASDGTIDAGTDGADDDAVVGGDDVPTPSGKWDSPTETDDWRIVYNYRGRQGTPDFNSNDLFLMTPLGTSKDRITELAKLDAQEEPLSCNYGCFISPDLKWMAIATGPPDANGFDFRLGQFTSPDLTQFKLIKDLVLADKVDFQFAGDRLYMSEINTCVGPSCQYDISFIDLSAPGAPTTILTFPLGGDLEQSTYTGHFKASPDGTKLILLNTTIRSVSVNMWKDGTGLVELDFICKFGTKDNCQGTGSEYSDVDPVAISPDGNHAVFFTFSDRWQRARVYDLENPGTIVTSILAEVPTGAYLQEICKFGALEDWQWERVFGDPVFTPDGEEILFLAETGCAAPNGDLPKKARRDIMRVKLDTLLSGKTLEESDVFSITKNPVMGAELGDVRDNLFVTSFDVSPDGATVVFTGTPWFDQSGEPIADTSSRHRNDREVFRARLDAKAPSAAVAAAAECESGLCQLTNDVTWQAESPRAVPPLSTQF